MGCMMGGMMAGTLVWAIIGLVALVVLVAGGMWAARRLLAPTAQHRLTPPPRPAEPIRETSVPDSQRAADVDRQQVIETLQTHVAAGRLTLDEFEQRSNEATQARTIGELRAVLAGLPYQAFR